MGKTLVELTAEIIRAQCQSTNMSTEEITNALNNTFKSLQALQTAEAQLCQEGGATDEGAKVTGEFAANPAKSIQKNKIVCLECGQEFKMLSPKHLKSHDLNGKEYRKKWGFSARQPLCAKSLSDSRKKAGKQRGLPENLKKSIDSRRKKKKGGGK